MGGINPGTVDATGDIATESKQSEMVGVMRDLVEQLRINNKHLQLLTETDIQDNEI